MVPQRHLTDDASDVISTGSSLTVEIYRPHKHRKLEGCAQHVPSNVDPEEPDDLTVKAPVHQVAGRTISCVHNGDLIYPRSIYRGWIPPMPPIPESVAITELKVSRTTID